MTDITANLAEIRGRVAEAERRSGRRPGEVELMVVSKTWPVETIGEVVAAGQRLFGENKVQEVCAKAPELGGDLRWHFIGHLQRNKVRKLLPHAEAIHSIDSEKLARYCDGIAGNLGRRLEVYLEVNLGAEDNKCGFAGEEVEGALEALRGLEHLDIVGLMCIPPDESDADRARRWFAGMRELRDGLRERSGLALPGLSMGMSHDYEVAIEEGATMVRVGSAVFGERRKG
jgi:PLP dependent protein